MIFVAKSCVNHQCISTVPQSDEISEYNSDFHCFIGTTFLL